MDIGITYEQAEAIYEDAMEAAQDVPDGNPEASKAEAVAQIKYRVGELFKTIIPDLVSQKDAAIAFVKGAKWWEYHQTKGTMWQSDQAIAAEEAEKRYKYKPTLDDLFPADTFRRIVEALAATEPKT